MSSNQSQSQAETKDEVYLEIWKVEQEYVRSRWTIATFFISVSFAILGFSFQMGLSSPKALAIRVAALFVYWFAGVIEQNLFVYNKFLRNYLLEMEISGNASLDIQGKTEVMLRSAAGQWKQRRTKSLLLLFGVMYTIGVILLWLLGL